MKTDFMIHVTLLCVLFFFSCQNLFPLAADAPARTDIFDKSNLVAWCIVPFDAKKRGPAERAEMLVRLGLQKVAYDWRDEHVPTFEEEILQYKKHDLEYFAFWDVHEDAFQLFEKYDLHPQIWKSIESPSEGSQDEKVEAAAKSLLPLVERSRQMGCQLGLYNHGGWSGEPNNMVAVCRWLRENANADHVGVVYNFHHGHDHVDRFKEAMTLMKPYLHCLNLNGMSDVKNLPIGGGKHEKMMLQIILESGYIGPIGILDHRSDTDTEESLRENLEGLETLVGELSS